MFLSTAGPSTFDFAVVPAGSIESGVRRMLTENVATSDLECIQGSGLIPLHETAVADHVGRQYGGEPTLRAILVNALSTSENADPRASLSDDTVRRAPRAQFPDKIRNRLHCRPDCAISAPCYITKCPTIGHSALAQVSPQPVRSAHPTRVPSPACPNRPSLAAVAVAWQRFHFLPSPVSL